VVHQEIRDGAAGVTGSPAGQAEGLDHVALAVRDLAVAAAAWEGLGFALTPLAVHADGAGVPSGTGNRCVMLGQGYVELISVLDPARPSRTLAGFIARYEGAHILSLAIDDAVAAQARLGRAGFAVALAASSRMTDAGEARFERLPVAEAVPRLQLIRQLTPELVWRAQDMVHPNRAAGLEEVLMVAEAPAALAALVSRVAGRPMRPDPVGGFVLGLPQGRVRVLSRAAMAGVLPGVAIPPSPGIAGMVIATDDGNRAVTAMGIGRAVPGGRIAMAAGAAVLFRPAPVSSGAS
jgi:hypothetical protein